MTETSRPQCTSLLFSHSDGQKVPRKASSSHSNDSKDSKSTVAGKL